MVDVTPVDYDPFAAEQAGTDWLAGVLGNAAKSIWDIPREALESSEQLRTTGDYDPAPIVNAAGLAMTGGLGGVPAEAGEAILGSGPIKAYHGSPYDFERFDLSKIGTGEGAQAYGHGFYFAGNPAVAETYRNTQQLLNTPESIAAGYLQKYEDPSAAAKAIRDDLSRATDDANFQKHGPEALRLIQSGAEPKPGKMYEVNINADPEHFLDWDKPLNEQSPKVQEAVRNATSGYSSRVRSSNAVATGYDWLDANGQKFSGGNLQPFDPMKMTGQQLIDALRMDKQNPVLASDTIRQAGIPGIKYLDQGSRPPRSYADTVASIDYYKGVLKDRPNDPEAQRQLAQYEKDLAQHENGTRNYVVFDDRLIDILKKYSIAGLIAGGASHFATQPVDHDPFSE
jgi:hypothetical protein